MATTPKTHLEKSIAGEVEPITHLEKVIAEYGGGGGGGGESTIAWKPTVAPDGTISWERTSSTTKPADQNIKGDKGDAGSQGADGVSPVITGAKSGKVTTLTIVDRDHPSGATLATINDGEDSAADVDTVAKELIEATGSGFCPGDFDIGSISISTVSGWTYYDNFPSRVRTKEGTTIHLKPGDVIGCTSYDNARFYIGWRDGDENYYSRGWLTRDFTVTQEGDYVILLAHLVDTTLVNKNELLDLFFIRRKVAARKSAYDLPCFYTGAIRIHAHMGTVDQDASSELIAEGLAAFEEAGKKHAWLCEADIQQTADGYLVCIHNTTVDATTDGTGAVASLTLAEIRALRLKRRDGTISDQQVPTIDEYLEICKKYNMIAAPELKAVRTAGFVAKVAQKIKDYGMEGQSFLITQVANAATYVRSVTDLPLMMIVADSNWEDSFAYAQANDNIIFTIVKTATTNMQEKINACHAIGVPCDIHVVNQKSEAEAYFDMGADIITSDLLTEGDWLGAYATEDYVKDAFDEHVKTDVPADAVFTDTVYDDTALAGRVTANETAIANRYTKTETDGKIAEAMTDVDNEHFHPVTALPSITDEDPTKRPKENHEYILIEYEQDGTTIKSETHYLFYGGAYHQKSTGGVSLDGYATEDFVNTKTEKMGEFDVTTIPQGPTGANEINAVLSNKDNEYARLSYVRKSDGTLPNAVNLGVMSGLGEDSFELPTKGYVDSAVTDKTLAPSGWGVAKTGIATVTFNNSKWSSSATVDISDLGFSSGADYDVVAQPTTGGTATPWGNAIAFVNADKGASSFSVSSFTMEESLSGTVNVKYTIFAKGYGGTHFVDGTGLPTGGVTGQVIAKRSDTDGDVLWKNVNTDATSVNKANLQGRMVGVYTDDIGGDTTKRFMVMNDSTNKEVAVSFRNAEAELSETARLYHKDAVDTLLVGKQDTLVSGTNIKTVNGESLLGASNIAVGVNFEVGAEKWYGTYTADGVTYQVYSKLLDIGALPSAAGVTNYPHGISGIKQILQINGFTNDGFVMNAPRQNAQDNISIYQAQKSGNIAVEVGKDRSSKNGFVMLIYAKNN